VRRCNTGAVIGRSAVDRSMPQLRFFVVGERASQRGSRLWCCPRVRLVVWPGGRRPGRSGEDARISDCAGRCGLFAKTKTWARKMGRRHRNQMFATHAQTRHRRPRPRAHGSETSSSGGRHPRGLAGWLRRRCRWAAARLRTATGVTRFALERERRAEQRPPWLGLLLWALACVGLFVSLLMQAGDLDRRPRLAAREVTQAQRPIVPSALVSGELDRVGRLTTEFFLPR
jgi:hypothetical protein